MTDRRDCGGSAGSGAGEHRDQEFGILLERAKIPRGEQQISLEATRGRVGEKLGELVATAGTESDDYSAARSEMTSKS